MPDVAVTIITKNEEAHIAAAIESVAWANEIIVVDCGSRDDTVAIAKACGARVEHRNWTGWVDQKNFAHSLASHDWILSLDADERVTPELAAEIRALLATEPAHRGYRMPRVGFMLGRWIRTTDFYPDYQLRLYDRRHARWEGELVHESVALDGPRGYLRHELLHYSYGDLEDQAARINRYSTLGADKLLARHARAGLIAVVFQAPAAFLRSYILRRGFMDGMAGFILSAMSGYSVFLKYAKLWEENQPVGKAIPPD